MKRAVVALIYDLNGRILSVSRKDDHSDFGLPGGKVEEGESVYQALVREVKEETGLEVLSTHEVYIGVDGEYEVYVYVCRVKGEIGTEEDGKLNWSTVHQLRTTGSFQEFNNKLFGRLER